MDFNTSYNALLRDNKPHVAPSAYEAPGLPHLGPPPVPPLTTASPLQKRLNL